MGKKPSKLGFSLIELLVVIAIVGVLAAIAVPAYQQYRTRAVFISAISSMEGTINELKAKYQSKGVFPSSIVFNGQTINLNVSGGWSYALTNVGNIIGLQYGYNSNAATGVVLWVLVRAPGITGTGNPPTGADTYTIGFGLRETSGALRTACGGSQGSSYTPFAYLPASCQCADVGTWAANGTGTGCPP